MSIDQLVRNFRDFMISCWPSISKVLEHHDWDDFPYYLSDWMQANWELLVEKQALLPDEFLVPYGYGSTSEYRYKDTEKTLTHRVVCQKKGKSDIRYYFRCFVTKTDGYFKIAPPFDLVHAEDIKTGDLVTLPFEELYFSMEKIN